MITRIRYEKDDGERFLFSSEQFLLPSGQLLSVILDTVENSYQIVDGTNVEQTTVTDGAALNLARLKKAVRVALLDLGVQLEKEVKKSRKSKQAA